MITIDELPKGNKGPMREGLLGAYLCTGCRYHSFDRPTKRSGHIVNHYCYARWEKRRAALGKSIITPDWCPWFPEDVLAIT